MRLIAAIFDAPHYLLTGKYREKREATDDKFLSRQYLSFPTKTCPQHQIRLIVEPSNMAAIGFTYAQSYFRSVEKWNCKLLCELNLRGFRCSALTN
jgi:hypothetical protein